MSDSVEGAGFWRGVLDTLRMRACVLDEQGAVIAANRAWRDFEPGRHACPACIQEGASFPGACGASPVTGVTDAREPGELGGLLGQVLSGRSEGFELEYTCRCDARERRFVARAARVAGSRPMRVIVCHDEVAPRHDAGGLDTTREGLLEELAASMPGVMYRVIGYRGGGLEYVYVSRGTEQLLGYPAQRFVDEPGFFLSLVPAEDRPAFDAAVRASARTMTPWSHDFRLRAADGTEKWVLSRAMPRRGADGSVIWTGIMTDISERKRLEFELGRREAMYRTLFETVPQGVVYQDVTGAITSANPSAQRILGLTLDQMQGRTSIDPRWRTLREDGSDFPGEEHPAMVALRTGEPVRDVVMGVDVPDRGYVWILVSAIPLFERGTLKEVYASFEDITERVLLAQELAMQAATDFLTGAANRRRFTERLNEEHQRLGRNRSLHSSVMALDLDHFKRINDTFGHAAGDAVLKHAADVVSQTIRRTDLFGRVGGEEFAVLLPDTGVEEATRLAERVRQRLADAPLPLGAETVRVTVSIGVSAIDPDDPGPETALLRADQALYQGKLEGRNTVRAWTHEGPAAVIAPVSPRAD